MLLERKTRNHVTGSLEIEFAYELEMGLFPIRPWRVKKIAIITRPLRKSPVFVHHYDDTPKKRFRSVKAARAYVQSLVGEG